RCPEDREEAHAERQGRAAVTARATAPQAGRHWLVVLLCCTVLVGIACGPGGAPAVALTDETFRALIETLSEPPGTFPLSDNLVSNEPHVSENARRLHPAGGVYIGVGPEQNFSYIARLEPVMAFIIDIRQENRNLHLMYKALFESANDRADFLSLLFARARPRGLSPDTSVRDLFAIYASVASSSAQQNATARLVRERLLTTHRFPLSSDDLASIDRALSAFAVDGPGIHYGRSLPPTAAGPSYRTLMTATDARGQSRSYLATEDAFAFVKSLQMRNLIVPIVGDFAGPTTVRRVGDYVRDHGGAVSAFYGSNVQVYLSNEQMAAFCANLSTLPSESDAWYIANKGQPLLTAKLKACGSRRALQN
ncbi:MAG: hypothetical protein H0T71_12905, partial [Acidobacteria bacterium]|nr:hypothetical protein [Acidobacteriota bacterium]